MRAYSFLLGIGLASLGLGCGRVVTFEGEEKAPGGPGKSPAASDASCAFSEVTNSSRAVLAWARGNEVVVVRADGTEAVPFVFGAGKAVITNWVQLVSRDGFVAATGSMTFSDGTYGAESVLLSNEGKVLWTSDAFPSGYGWQYLGEKGTLALAMWGGAASATLLVWPSGATKEIPGIVPVGGPSMKGRFPALLTPDSYQLVYGWGAPDEASEPLAYDASWNGSPTEAGGALYYVGLQDPESQKLFFVRESESDLQTFSLASEAPWLGAVAPPFAIVHENWMWDAPHRLANTDAGTMAEIAPAPPGLTAFGMAYYNGPVADERGSVWMPLRDATVGGIYRTTGQGTGWERVGRSFSNVWDATIVSRGGTVVLATSNLQGYFPMDPWETPAAGAPEPEAEGPFVQVLRPEDGIARDIEPNAASFVLSRTGACLAYTHDDRVVVLSVGDGESRDIGKVDLTIGFSPPVWVE